MLGENCPVITPTQKDSSTSVTERSATPSRNPSPRQLDNSAEILPYVESLQQPSAPTMWLDGIALEKFLIRIQRTSSEIPKDQTILGRLFHRSQIQMYIRNVPTQQQRSVP